MAMRWGVERVVESLQPQQQQQSQSQRQRMQRRRTTAEHMPRVLGNRAVVQMLRGSLPARDPSELEAERVAARIERGEPGPAAIVARPPTTATATVLQPALRARAGRGAPLSESLRASLEPQLGADLGAVRVHSDEAAGRLSRLLGARAFTHGSDIFLGAGQASPQTAAGRRLLTHELVHTVQQGASARAGEPAVQRAPVVQRDVHPYPQIVDQFEYGDLIYGLSFARGPTIQGLLRRYYPTGDNQPFASVQDELNNTFVGTQMGANGGLSQYGDASPGLPPSQQVLDQAQGFRNFLEQHQRYGPNLRQQNGESLGVRERTWARIAAACKAGLEYAVSSGHRIHFIIDNIDMVGVVKKRRYAVNREVNIQPHNRFAKHDTTGDSGNRDITPTELRWLYRQWQTNNFGVRQQVTFWKDGHEAQAPWDADPELWNLEYSHKELRGEEARDVAGGVWTALHDALAQVAGTLEHLGERWNVKIGESHVSKALWRSRKKKQIRRQGAGLLGPVDQQLGQLREALRHQHGRVGQALEREAQRLGQRLVDLRAQIHELMRGRSTQAIGPRIRSLAAFVAEEMQRIEALQGV